MSDADKHIARFAEHYEQICARHGPWRVTAQGKALLKDFSPLHIAKLCEMFDEETPASNGGQSRRKTTTSTAAERLCGKRPSQANRERPQMPPPPPREPAHQLRQPTRLQCDRATSDHSDAGAMPMRRRVLVPLSGGVASTACLWWALQRPEFDVHIVHLVGVERSNKYEQMLALVQMARYARALDGKPLAAQFAQEQRKISQKRTLANVCDDMDATVADDSGAADAHQMSLKRLAALQHDRFTILPMPTQPYTLENCDISSDVTLERDSEPLKHHPLSYALMYRQVLRSACALQCDDIVWGLFDDARSVVEMLHPLFSSSLRRHQNWFPFADRHESFAAFVAMSERSDQIWSAYSAPIFDPTSGDAQQSSAQRRKTSSRKPSQTDRAMMADDGEKPVRPIVPQMTGPSLAPDAAQYATTCRQYMQSRSHDDAKQEVAHRSDSVTTGHAGSVRMMRWCGSCVDCAVWRDVASNRKRATTTAAGARKVELTTQHTLLDAYNQLLNEAKNDQSHARRIVDVKRRSEAQKEVQKYRASLLQESNERKRSRESIGGGVYSCQTNKRVKVSVQDEKDDEEDEADAEEEGNDDEDDEDNDDNSEEDEDEEEEEEELADDEDNDEEEQDGAMGHDNDFLEDEDDLDDGDNEDDDDEDDDDADDFDDDFDYE